MEVGHKKQTPYVCLPRHYWASTLRLHAWSVPRSHPLWFAKVDDVQQGEGQVEVPLITHRPATIRTFRAPICRSADSDQQNVQLDFSNFHFENKTFSNLYFRWDIYFQLYFKNTNFDFHSLTFMAFGIYLSLSDLLLPPLPWMLCGWHWNVISWLFELVRIYSKYLLERTLSHEHDIIYILINIKSLERI